jgi:hypothetical protein
MKKFLACLFILTMGLSCTKEDPMIACGCSPAESPTFILIIKDSLNNDLLNTSLAGSVNENNIKISYKENDVSRNISFIVREPFSYGENLKNKFPFHQLISSQLGILRVSNKAQEFYIDLGDGKVQSLTFDYNISKGYPENVKIDGVPVPSEPSLPENYGKIYYLVK